MSPLSPTNAGVKLLRPPFPSGWASLPITRSNLTLANTLPVGQSFLWHRHQLLKSEAADGPTEEYSRAVDDPPRVVCLRQTTSSVFYTAVYRDPAAWASDQAIDLTRRWIDDYFQLTRYPNLEQLYENWRLRDAEFFAKVELDERATGVRVLRQDPWECLFAFITSTNNHIPRITSLMQRLSERFSSPLLSLDNPDGELETTYYLFPSSEDLPTQHLEAILRELGFGYRARYLESTLSSLRERGIVEDELRRWRSLPMEEVRKELIMLKGVGRKVADCVMLMCMDQPSLIPIDTHIYAIAARHPQLPSKLRRKTFSSSIYDDVQSFLSSTWGPLGGWCQAVVFAADLKPRTLKPNVPTIASIDSCKSAAEAKTPAGGKREAADSNVARDAGKRARRGSIRS